jgi:hypothetical protein
MPSSVSTPSCRAAATLVVTSALLLAALPASAVDDVCTCGAGDDFAWGPIGATSGAGRWSCSGGDGIPGADDHFAVGAACRVQVVADLVQDGLAPATGLEVQAGGELDADVLDGDRLRLSLNDRGLDCAGTCRLRGAFRAPMPVPLNQADPASWTAGALEPCGGDCVSTPAMYCVRPTAAWDLSAAVSRTRPGTDLGVGTEDWLCIWDFDRSDLRVPFDDGACYPVSSVDPGAAYGAARICVDVRQGHDSEYPYRLREIDEGTLADALGPGGGCSAVLDAATGRRTPACGGELLRVAASTSSIAADDELVGRFVRFEGAQGEPGPPYKILQTLDCAAGPPAPHVCDGRADDVVVLGSLAGVAAGLPVGARYWIDYGWRSGDTFFVMSPLQLDSATIQDDDSGVHLSGALDVQGVHITDLGGGVVGGIGSTVVNVSEADVLRWRHVILRNDTGDFPQNVGQDLVLDGLEDAVLGHTHIVSNTGHGVVLYARTRPSRALELQDFSIRHHGDGCFNHSNQGVTPQVTIRRGWCAFIQQDALSAQWFAWQLARPTETRVWDSACDACDGGHSGATLRSNSTTQPGGWSLRRALLWSPVGGLPPEPGSSIADSLFVGFRGTPALSAPLLSPGANRLVVRNVAIATNEMVQTGTLDVSNSIFRDLLIARNGGSAVYAGPGSLVSNNAWVNVDTSASTCLTNGGCTIAQELAPTSADVRWIRNVFAWLPGTGTQLGGALRLRATAGSPPPRYEGMAIAFHDWRYGTSPALQNLTASTVGIPDWDDGPCFDGNERDVDPSAQAGLPPGTSQGVPLGFVDPAAYRFDVRPGSVAHQLRCGLDPVKPPGNTGYHYFHARTGLAPELMADDADADGRPENTGAPACAAGSTTSCDDNCPTVANPDQRDDNGNGIGNACETACYDGVDNDGDGWTDYPDDPGCATASHPLESPQCQDGINNDPGSDGLIDFDGGASLNGGVPLTAPDPQCGGIASRNREAPAACGLGAELTLLAALLSLLGARRPRSVSSPRAPLDCPT